MFRSVFGRGKQQPVNNDEMIKIVLNQAKNFETALRAMDYVLDDRSTQGLALLTQGNNDSKDDETVKVLARGVIEFLEATLSFETKEMKKAAETLGKAENLSWKSKQKAEKEKINSSKHYPPGTLYTVTYTESMLLHALLMLFSESMLDAAKAVLKLRKAYYTLQSISDSIKKVQQQKNLQQLKSNSSSSNSNSNSNLNSNSNSNQSIHSSYSSLASSTSKSSKRDQKNGFYTNNESSGSFFNESGQIFVSPDLPFKLNDEESKNTELLNFAEKVHQMRQQRLAGGHIDNPPAINRLRNELGFPIESNDSNKMEEHNEHVPIFDNMDESQATIDEFIYSGVNLCFGIIQVVISLLPPTIGAVLSVIGFKGSREDGLRLVWKATRERNVHGCIGLLALMFYYDGPFQFIDDDFDIPMNNANNSVRKPEDENDPNFMDNHLLLHPGYILEDSLLRARAIFPNSALWLLNEARMLSGKGKLLEAVKLMDSIDINSIQMRQVKILMIFDRANTLVHLHQYDRAADDLLALVGISDWSHALYTYFAGCCYLENWRMCQLGLMKENENGNQSKEFYESKAKELIFSASNYLGKKTFKSKNLPLDRFMLRKVEQFQQTQKRLNLKNPLDAIATSPVHELAYFYNGYNRMTEDGLRLTEKLLTEYQNPAIKENNPDQELIRDLLLSLTYRRLGKVEEGAKLLDDKVLPNFFSMENGKPKFIKKDEDPWAYPTTLYERALFTWKLKGMDGLQESKDWLIWAQNYADDYELSARVGMKIKAALDRVETSL